VVSIQPTADSAAEEAGVVLFWAPESVEGRIIDSKVDIWALGIVIMEILNGGKAPYEDEECSEDKVRYVVSNITECFRSCSDMSFNTQIKDIILEIGRPHYPPSLPPMLVNFMDRCLEVDPRHRASAEELLKVRGSAPYKILYYSRQNNTTSDQRS
jgi:serine/threonine protein kinase